MNCEHEFTYDKIIPSGSVHYAEVRCTKCSKHLGWRTKPENIEKRSKLKEILERLRDAPLNGWEEKFWLSVSKLRKWSPKQELKIKEVAERHGIHNP